MKTKVENDVVEALRHHDLGDRTGGRNRAVAVRRAADVERHRAGRRLRRVRLRPPRDVRQWAVAVLAVELRRHDAVRIAAAVEQHPRIDLPGPNARVREHLGDDADPAWSLRRAAREAERPARRVADGRAELGRIRRPHRLRRGGAALDPDIRDAVLLRCVLAGSACRPLRSLLDPADQRGLAGPVGADADPADRPDRARPSGLCRPSWPCRALVALRGLRSLDALLRRRLRQLRRGCARDPGHQHEPDDATDDRRRADSCAQRLIDPILRVSPLERNYALRPLRRAAMLHRL